jgi:hypothetical protein
VLAAMAALAFAVAGCGGDDDGGETTGGGEVTLTKVEFIKQGDQICEKAEARSEEEAEAFAEESDFDLENPQKEQLEEAVAEVLVPALSEQAEELRELGVPEGDEEQVEEILTSLEDAAAGVEEDPGSVFEGEPLKEATELAKDYGFKVCGEE